MDTLTIVRYQPEHQTLWDRFMETVRQNVFIFKRAYMDYHADRFIDHSLMIYDEGVLVALLPAHRDGATLISHGGLTFGGLLYGPDLKISSILDVFNTLKTSLKAQGVQKVIYKAVPLSYATHPCEEDRYALYLQDAKLLERAVAVVVDAHQERLPYSERRRRGLKKAEKQQMVVERMYDYDVYMKMVAELLQSKYQATPIHSVQEIKLLASRFPDNIQLWGATLGGELVAGVLVYESAMAARAQYIASTEEGRDCGALDRVMDVLLQHYAGKKSFDFGTSHVGHSRVLNANLVRYKEELGARTVLYDTYVWDIA